MEKAMHADEEINTSSSYVLPSARIGMYPKAYREVVVSIAERLQSIRGAAELVRASAASICRWKKTITTGHARSKGSLVTDLMIDAIKLYMFENPTCRAGHIQLFLSNKFGITVSRQLVQVVLSTRMNLSFKRTRKRGPDISSNPEFRVRFREFVRVLHNAFETGKNIVSVDESGADPRCKPLYAYAERGQPAILHNPPVACGAHVRTSLLMAIASDGTNAYELTTGGVDADAFADFILSMPFKEGSILIMDNHSIHDTDAVKVAMIVKGYTPLFTPPYSPEFNPIEMIFGTIKTEYYALRYSKEFTTVQDTLRKMIEKHATPQKIKNYIRHVKDIVQNNFTIAIQLEGEQQATLPHASHNVHDRWLGIGRKKKNP